MLTKVSARPAQPHTQQQQQQPSSAPSQWGSCRHQTAALCHVRRRAPRRTRARTTIPVAMVNVDLSPSLLLGIGMIGGGLALYQVRLSKPWISRDYDVVISSIAILTGGILIFQVSLPIAQHFSARGLWPWHTLERTLACLQGKRKHPFDMFPLGLPGESI